MCTCTAILEAGLWETLNKAFSTDKCCPHEIKFKHYILKASRFNIDYSWNFIEYNQLRRS